MCFHNSVFLNRQNEYIQLLYEAGYKASCGSEPPPVCFHFTAQCLSVSCFFSPLPPPPPGFGISTGKKDIWCFEEAEWSEGYGKRKHENTKFSVFLSKLKPCMLLFQALTPVTCELWHQKTREFWEMMKWRQCLCVSLAQQVWCMLLPGCWWELPTPCRPLCHCCHCTQLWCKQPSWVGEFNLIYC